MTGPDVSIVIPHYNDLERLDRCLAALSGQTLPSDRFEIIVSDNASTVGKAAVEKVIAGRARLVIAFEKGAGPARNVGVQAARGHILAFTDSDCLPEPRWLEAGIALLDRYDIVGGRMVVLFDEGRAMTGAEAFECVFAFDNKRYVQKKGFSVTANLFCKRVTFDTVGDFQQHVSEDADWCHRARDAGFSIGYAEQAVAGHPARTNWKELKRKWERVNAEMYTLSLAEGRSRLQWAVRNLGMPLSVIAHTPAVMSSSALRNGAERRAAWMMLARLRCWRMLHSARLLMGQDN